MAPDVVEQDSGPAEGPEAPRLATLEKGAFTLVLLVVLVVHVAWLAVAPRTSSTGPGQLPGTPPRLCPRNVHTSTLADVLDCIMALDGSRLPPTPEQRHRMLPQATRILDAAGAVQVDLRAVLGVLRESQLKPLYDPHDLPSISEVPREERDSADPRLTRVLAVLERKAGATAAPPSGEARSDALQGPSAGSGVFDGLLWLETRSPTPLTPAQARAALDALRDIRGQGRKMGGLVGDIVAALSDAQREILYSTAPPERLEMLGTAQRFKAWVEKP